MKTINVTFDPASLPSWAQRYPAVVELCESDLGFRCNVFSAKNLDYKNHLLREAHRLAEIGRKGK